MADLAYGEVYVMNKVQARMRLVRAYQEKGSLSEVAREWRTSRHTVRKWVRRYQEEGEKGPLDRSRRPRHSPNRTPAGVEDEVLDAWERTHYGRHRLAIYLQEAKSLCISAHTIRHILRRRRPPQKRRARKPLYPALWVWEQQEPLRLFQTDAKDIHDKDSLDTERTTHLRRAHLPRYQWTACDGRTRLRLLAYSHRLNRTNGIAFLIWVLLCIQAHGVEGPIAFQTDWGEEFGGDNPDRIEEINRRFLRPLGGELKRYPKGRKGYNGRVERSHRSDDEEFYRPYLLAMRDPQDVLQYAHHWVYFYNTLRPHFGHDMDQQPPLAMLRRLGYDGPDSIATVPPILLDDISADLLLACDPETGNDLLAKYTANATLPATKQPNMGRPTPAHWHCGSPP